MINSDTVANLGTPLGADLGDIERQLSAFWKDAGQYSDAATRACSCNLIVIVSGREEAEAQPSMLADVAEWRPCRSIVAFQDVKRSVGEVLPLQGWIRVQCHPQPGGGPQVCSEVITLGGRHETAGGLVNAVVSLLVPDLPLYLYWRSRRADDWELVLALLHFSNVLIMNSGNPLADDGKRVSRNALLAAVPQGVATRDLSWAYLTEWRDLIAQFFDAQATRSFLGELAEVEISHVPTSLDQPPPLALLLAGWLASRLGWKSTSGTRTGTQWVWRLSGAGGDILLRITAGRAKERDEGIGAVSLITRRGDSFTIRRTDDQSRMIATAVVVGSQPIVHTVPCQPMREADLLIGELAVSGEDLGFRSAFAAALDLEQQLRRFE